MSMTAQVMFYATLALAGLASFLLVVSLWPQRFFQAARERAEEDSANVVRAAGGMIVGRLGDINRPLVSPAFQQRMTKKFVAMGAPKMRAEDFIAFQELSALLFTIAGLLALNLIRRPLIYAFFFSLGGFLLPYVWLADRIKKRHHKIMRALPYALDLLTLSVEAGLDFQAAVAKVVEKGQPGPLREELAIMLGEIRLGKTREQALRNMAARIQLAQMTTFVSNLVQADRMGTSLGKILRIQSTQMRIERTHRAEKLANQAPVKLLFPLVFCIFPTVFVVLFTPIIYRWMMTQ